MLPFLFLLISGVGSEEYSTPSSLLGPRNFNHHPFDQYLEEVEPTKQGPVLFPNDAPPPPRPPLIVTSRPLIESIARSELNPDVNNSIASPSQIKPEFRLKPGFRLKPEFRIKPEYGHKPDYSLPEYGHKPEYSQPEYGQTPENGHKPGFLARIKDYRPFTLSTPLPDYEPYSEVTKSRLNGLKDVRYTDFEQRTVLPPIYKAIADHAKSKVLKLKHQPNPAHYNYQAKEPPYSQQYQHNDVRDDGESDYDHDSNYAFSYRVKDHHTGDDFSHSQHSSGSATNGEYRVRLPDGRMQIVSYTADENGYKANVRYDDEDKKAGNRIDKHDYNNAPDLDRYRSGLGANRPGLGENRPDLGGNRPGLGANRPVLGLLGLNRPVYDVNRPAFDINRPAYINRPNNDVNRPEFAVNKPIYDINRPYDLDRPIYDGGRPGVDDNHNDYKENNFAENKEFKPEEHNPPVKEENAYEDFSKEYYNNDYSLEYEGKDDKYEPHRSKFSTFIPKNNLGTIIVPNPANTNQVSSTTVKPSYEELKPLFVTKSLYEVQPTENYLKNVEFHVPSTTPNSILDGTTEHVVLINRTKPNLYTNIRNFPLTVTPPTVTSNSDFVTPKSYLVSTIASLKRGEKPVLSNAFIDRINKYLTFT